MKRLITIFITLLLLIAPINTEAEVRSLASTSITGVSYTTAYGQITGLGNLFNTDYYISAGVATSVCTFGQSTQPSGTKGTTTAYAPDVFDNTSTNIFSVSGLTSGTYYTLYGWARAANGLYYPAGSASFTTLTVPPPVPNPVSNLAAYPDVYSIYFSWTNGSTYTQINYVIDGSFHFISGSSTSVTVYNLSPSTTYTFVIWGENAGGTSATRSITSTTDSIPRPSYFTGFNTLITGNTFPFTSANPYPVTAANWNNFQNHLKLISDYLDVSDHPYANVSVGDDVRTRFNNIRSYILITLTPPGTAPPSIAQGDLISEQFKDLQDWVNSIP